jgi:hypothetical protein
MDMNIQNGHELGHADVLVHVNAAYPCPYYKSCPCPCCMSKSIPCVHVQVACRSLYRVSMSRLHVHKHTAACPCPCCMTRSMLHVHVHAACPCSCFMSMSMLHVYVHGVSIFPCCMSVSEHGHGHAHKCVDISMGR